jgi:hypothetical protein
MLWSEKSTDKTGLPRPHFYTSPEAHYVNGKKFLHKIIPIPYQSKPGIKNTFIRLNVENEKKAVKEGLCSYCGIKIKDDEESIRWIIENENFLNYKDKDIVPSDFHPFHLKCMKQARIYCPFMRTLKDQQFSICLNKDNLKIAQENFKKYFVIQWEKKEREK